MDYPEFGDQTPRRTILVNARRASSVLAQGTRARSAATSADSRALREASRKLREEGRARS